MQLNLEQRWTWVRSIRGVGSVRLGWVGLSNSFFLYFFLGWVGLDPDVKFQSKRKIEQIRWPNCVTVHPDSSVRVMSVDYRDVNDKSD